MAMEPAAILDTPISTMLKPDLVVQLQQLCAIHTVGGFLRAWECPNGQKQIEQIFDSPGQARQALAVCASWLGHASMYVPVLVQPWWPGEGEQRLS